MHANCRTDLSKRLPSSAAYILAKMELTSSGGPLYFYIERENVPESETESVIIWSTILMYGLGLFGVSFRKKVRSRWQG